MDKVNTIVLSASTCKDLADALKIDDQADKKWVKAADSLKAEGVNYLMLGKDKEGGVPAIKNQVKAVIISTFSEKEQKLLATETKALDESAKTEKRIATQKIGKKLDKVRNHLKPKTSRGPIVRKALEDKLAEAWQDQIDDLQKAEDVHFDTVAVQRMLKELIDLVQ